MRRWMLIVALLALPLGALAEDALPPDDAAADAEAAEGEVMLAEPIRLNDHADRIYRTDGSIVEGTIVAEGPRGVKILVPVEQAKEEEGVSNAQAEEMARIQALEGAGDEPDAAGEQASLDAMVIEEAPEDADQPVEEIMVRRDDIQRVVRGERLATMPREYHMTRINGMAQVVSRSKTLSPPKIDPDAGAPAELPTAAKQDLNKLPSKIPAKVDDLKPEHIEIIAKHDQRAKLLLDSLAGGDPAKALQMIKSNDMYRDPVQRWLDNNAGRDTGEALQELQGQEDTKPRKKQETGTPMKGLGIPKDLLQ